jgi:hypothetical protein
MREEKVVVADVIAFLGGCGGNECGGVADA